MNEPPIKERDGGDDILSSRIFIGAGIVASILFLVLMFLLGGGVFMGQDNGETGHMSGVEGDGHTEEEGGDGESQVRRETEQDEGESEPKDVSTEQPESDEPSEEEKERDIPQHEDPPVSEDGGYVIEVETNASAGLEMEGQESGAPSFFGIWDRGGRIVYVMDRSGSMDGARLRKAREELGGAVEQMDADVKFSIILFDDSTESYRDGKWIRATGTNVEKTVEWIRSVSSGGGTRVLPAMKQALQMRPEVVYLLTDAKFDHDAPGDVIRRENRRVDARIHTIEIGGGGSTDLMKEIARTNSGIHRKVQH